MKMRFICVNMLDAAQKAQLFIKDKTRQDYDNDEVLRIALTHLVQTIGEAARNVSPVTQAASPTMPWKQIMGIRHRIVHNYAHIDEDVIWKTVTSDLIPLIQTLETMLPPDNV